MASTWILIGPQPYIERVKTTSLPLIIPIRSKTGLKKSFNAIVGLFKNIPVKMVTLHVPYQGKAKLLKKMCDDRPQWPICKIRLPTVDHITNKLKALGKGAYIYKTDISKSLRRIKVDP